MRSRSSSITQVVAWGVLAVLASLVPLFLFQIRLGAGSPIHPFSDDSILVWNLLQGLIRGEVHPFRALVLPRMAAPFSPLVFSEGFPITEQLQLSFLKGLSCFIRDPIELGDFYFVAGYPLAAASFCGSAVWLGIRAPIAFGLSIAFAYLPFHWIRYDHIFLSHYWILAPAAAVLLRSIDASFAGRRSLFYLGCFAFFVALWHSYAGFFFCGILGLVLAARAMKERVFRRRAITAIAVAGVGAGLAIGISTMHYELARWRSTEPPLSFKRERADAQIYRLRPAAVFLPVEHHRIPLFARVRESYMKSGRFREGMNESLGTLGLIGIGLFAWAASLRKKRSPDEISKSGFCQALIFLLAGPAGIAVIISYTLTPIFRCPNRISPMLGAFALFAVGFRLSVRFREENPGQRIVVALLGIGLAVFAVWDQVPAVSYDPTPRAEISSAQRLVAEIDEMLGSGNVLQLPTSPFPEAPPIAAMGDYAHSIAPLFSRNVRYSYGAWKKTRAFAEIESVARDPLAIGAIRKFGYSGIWIDRYGYQDRAKDLISALQSKLGRAPIVSEDGRRVFFDIR